MITQSNLYARTNKYTHSVTKFFVAVFLLVSIFGIFVCTSVFHVGMSESMSMMNMPGKPQAAQAEVSCVISQPGTCSMSTLEHINAWQNLFMRDFSLYASLMLAVFFWMATLVFFRKIAPSVRNFYHQRYKNYQNNHSNQPLYNIFIGLFSSGILQPKLCA